MAGPAHPIRQHPAVGWQKTGIQTIPLTISADVDLTSPNGPTNGYCTRWILNGGEAGNLIFYDMLGQGPFTVALAANQLLQQSVSYIVDSGTTAGPISAVL
jgi:hypothetical protein